mgnify:CR=1 FL=1
MSESPQVDLSNSETSPLATYVEHKSDDAELSISTVDFIEQSIVELLKQSIDDSNFEYKFQLTLDNDVVDMFHKIMALSPNSFVDIQKSLSAVVLDGKINSEDIPHLIVLLKAMYQTINAVKNSKVSSTKMTELVGGVIKLTFHVLVKEGKVKIDDDKHCVFLDQFDELVDSCVSLLSFAESLKPVGCFKKLCKM